jgi:hypothetical protein
MPAIRIEELRKIFGKFVALDGLSLTVEEGTVFGFLVRMGLERLPPFASYQFGACDQRASLGD